LYATSAVVIKYLPIIVGLPQWELSNQRILCIWTKELFLFSEILLLQVRKTFLGVGKKAKTHICLAGYALSWGPRSHNQNI